ncbi:MAG: cytochrome C [Phycisphaerae bacterium]|nr:cytochrome C [Phycisphaerae bacterium]
MIMRRLLWVFTAAAVAGLTGWAFAGIEGSKHDFSDKPWSGGDKCSACHVPHREKAPTAAPLWDPNADLNRVFGTPITSDAQSGSGTLSCLRCHDGTIARDSFGGDDGGRRSIPTPYTSHPGFFKAGIRTGNHPVGVKYPRFEDGYKMITTVTARGDVILPAGRVECVSCHDPHNMAELPYMLVVSNARSALCLTCHKK